MKQQLIVFALALSGLFNVFFLVGYVQAGRAQASGAYRAAAATLRGAREISSPELADLTIYVIDVSAGDKIPRKGGPGITKSDLLVINKTDLAPHVGASLEIMDRDAKKMRGDKPFVFTNLKTNTGVSDILEFVVKQGML